MIHNKAYPVYSISVILISGQLGQAGPIINKRESERERKRERESEREKAREKEKEREKERNFV